MPHKRIDVAIRAFNELRRPLVVIGNGPDSRRLRRLAGPTITFTGRVERRRGRRAALAAARALVVTATEEFGIAAVEAQAAGRPVIALADGGVRETVIEGVTGTFYASARPGGAGGGGRGASTRSRSTRARASRTPRASTSRHFRHGLRAVVDRTLAARRGDSPSPRRSPRRPAGLVWQP